MKFITAFTLGHCVTLVFATLLHIKSQLLNAGLIFAGLLLLLMQLHGYQHTRFIDDFPMNKDEHFQIHENMERNRDPSRIRYSRPRKGLARQGRP